MLDAAARNLLPMLPNEVTPDTWDLTDRHSTWVLDGIHESLSILWYETGDFFKKHKDGAIVESDERRSFVTLLIYLEAAQKGGRTSFYKSYRDKQARGPAQGEAVGRCYSFRHQYGPSPFTTPPLPPPVPPLVRHPPSRCSSATISSLVSHPCSTPNNLLLFVQYIAHGAQGGSR